MTAALAALFLLLWAPQGSLAGEKRWCEHVIDGDTVVLENGEKIRLIGVDAPEIAHGEKRGERGGEAAKVFLKKLAEGKEVELEYDFERTDKYGRTLAYLYTPKGELINLLLIEKGYARAMRFFDYRQKARFLKAEKSGAP